MRTTMYAPIRRAAAPIRVTSYLPAYNELRASSTSTRAMTTGRTTAMPSVAKYRQVSAIGGLTTRR